MMANGKSDHRSRLDETVRELYRRAQQELEAAEARAEAEFYGLVAARKASRTFNPDFLDDYARDLAFEMADKATDEYLEQINVVIDSVFDPTVVDPVLLAEDPYEAELAQIQVAYQDHLEARLSEIIAADHESLVAASGHSTAPRLRRSDLAAPD